MEAGGEIPRPAATVVVARERAGGIEVLVLRRGGESRFLAGYVVFPGGAVEPQDEALAVRWFGSPGQAARACAVRELAEETGLLLTAKGLVRAREAMEGLARVDASPPNPAALREISHWIAPEDVPVRFDARFYAVRSQGGLEPRPDGAEADRAWWTRPVDVLADFAAGRARLYWPTIKMLEALAGCRSVEEVLALHVSQVERDDEVAPL